MSTDEYNRKLEEGKKLVNSLKKDLKYREEQEKRGQTTYSLDAEIRGSFSSLEQVVDKVEKIFNNFRANPRDFGLSNQQISKRQQQYDQLSAERTNLKRQFDSFFQKKSSTKDLLGDTSSPNKPDYSSMNTKQLLTHKQTQQQQQDEAIGDLINILKNTKKGGQAINAQLKEQDALINVIDEGMDENTRNMSSVRRNMMKLLQESSNCCLIVVIILEIIAIVCIGVLWN